MYYSLPADGLRMTAETFEGGSSARATSNGTSVWAVELLKGERWVLLRRGLFRQVAHFASYDEAVQAAVRAWQRYDCPARPLQLGPGDRLDRPA